MLKRKGFCFTVLLLCLAGPLLMKGQDTDNPQYQKGLAFYKQKKFLMAIGSFKSAVDSGFQSAQLYFFLANAYANNEDYDKAIDNYKLAMEMAATPDFQGQITHNLGQIYYIKKDYPKSIDYFNRAYSLNKTLNQVFWFKGMAFYKMQDKTNTISEWEHYLELITNGPESDNIRRALAILKATNFNFATDNLFASGKNGTNKSGTGENTPVAGVQPLIDIEDVLDQVKIQDKGKVSDNSLEDIEK